MAVPGIGKTYAIAIAIKKAHSIGAYPRGTRFRAFLLQIERLYRHCWVRRIGLPCPYVPKGVLQVTRYSTNTGRCAYSAYIRRPKWLLES
jgi:hypothetical protein